MYVHQQDKSLYTKVYCVGLSTTVVNCHTQFSYSIRTVLTALNVLCGVLLRRCICPDSPLILITVLVLWHALRLHTIRIVQTAWKVVMVCTIASLYCCMYYCYWPIMYRIYSGKGFTFHQAFPQQLGMRRTISTKLKISSSEFIKTFLSLLDKLQDMIIYWWYKYYTSIQG